MLPQSTIQRIADEAKAYAREHGRKEISYYMLNYKAGATAEAERAQEIINALQVAMEKSIDGRITAEHTVRLALALTKYNNPVNK